MCIFSCVYVDKFWKTFFVNPSEFSFHVLKLDSWEILTSTVKVAAYRFILTYQTQQMKAKKTFHFAFVIFFIYLFISQPFFFWVSCARQFTSWFYEIVMDVRNLIFTLKFPRRPCAPTLSFLSKQIKKYSHIVAVISFHY